MLKSLTAQNAASLVIFLLSGGGSSMAEKPIDDEISLADLIATYRALVHSGAPIGEINAIRKHLSAIKGGRLALAASPARQVSLLVSDVPDNTPMPWPRVPPWLTPAVQKIVMRSPQNMDC
jgi:hydroxypyruvate reductase